MEDTDMLADSAIGGRPDIILCDEILVSLAEKEMAKMKSLIVLISLMIILMIASCGPSSQAVKPAGTVPAESQKGEDILLPEPGQETARLLILLERGNGKPGDSGGDDYYYATGRTMSKNKDYAIKEAYRNAMAMLAGKLPVGIKRSDLEKIVEKTDETVTQDRDFWKVVVKVRVSKSDIAALLPGSPGRKPSTEVAAGILTDRDFFYVYGSAASKNMQFAVDKAKHDSRVRLAQYLSGSTDSEVTITGGQTIKQSVAKRNQIWLAEVALKAPVALNTKKPIVESAGK